jgi:hypothetical protein
MDTVQPSIREVYQWPTSILGASHLPVSQLGLIGWTYHDIGNKKDETLYVPLSIQPNQLSHSRTTYSFTIVPPFELNEVFLSLARLGPKDRLEKPIRDAVPLAYGYYPATAPIVVDLPLSSQSGIYLVEVSATIRAGGNTSIRFWFYHNN